ncbi:MAG: hypothetical protein ABSF46_32105 [Terriglobia bacterium]|jgi:hypothetical protein
MKHTVRRTLKDHLIRRALAAPPELAAELLRRGMLTSNERERFLCLLPNEGRELPALPLGPVRFATLLAQGDTVLAAWVVLRNLIRPDELVWLYRLLALHESNEKCRELTRIVERALEGRKGNVRTKRG